MRGNLNSTAANLFGQATRRFREDRLQEADALCAEAIALGDFVIESLDLRAAIALQQGDLEAAADYLAQAVAVDGGNASFAEASEAKAGLHYNLGNVLKRLGRIDQACDSFRAAFRCDPEALGLCLEIALTLLDAGRNDEARPWLRILVASAPEEEDPYFQLGIADLREALHHDALAKFHRGLVCKPEDTRIHVNAAVMHRELERPDDALLAMSVAIALDPADGHLYSNLAMFLKESRDDKRHAALLRHAVALIPDNADFQYGLAMSGKFSPGDDRLEGLESLMARIDRDNTRGLINLHFSLGKAYEDLGEFDRSFQLQQQGNALKRGTLDYDEERMLGGFARIAEAFTGDVVNADPDAGDPSETPIFVLGMPRSGSTLIEQILASHPHTFGAGELPIFPNLVSNYAPERDIGFPENAALLSAEDYRIIGRRYVEALTAKATGFARIVDKQTENFRLIGVIRRALPKAKIIHTRRDPVDTCLSIYSKLFASDMPFAYDLAEIGRYWRLYDRLMAHWRAVLPPGAMLEIDYESMVADQEGQTRRLLDYCDLEWDGSCLSFHETKRVVRTASSQQVRRPLYSSSVGRWRPPAEALDRLMQGLEGR